MCNYFLKCENKPTILVSHPVLKVIQCCDQCAKHVGIDPDDCPKIVDCTLEENHRYQEACERGKLDV